MRCPYGDLGHNELCNSLQSSFPDISGCNIFERRGVIERIEGRSGVQLSSERSAAEARSRPSLQLAGASDEEDERQDDVK